MDTTGFEKLNRREVSKIIGKKIRQMREQKHMQVTELADKAKLSQAHLSNIELGKRHAHLGVLVKITKALDEKIGIYL